MRSFAGNQKIKNLKQCNARRKSEPAIYLITETGRGEPCGLYREFIIIHFGCLIGVVHIEKRRCKQCNVCCELNLEIQTEATENIYITPITGIEIPCFCFWLQTKRTIELYNSTDTITAGKYFIVIA